MQINTAMQRTGNSTHKFGHPVRTSKYEKITAQSVEGNGYDSGKVTGIWQHESKTSNKFFAEFYISGFYSADGHMATVEKLAMQYAKLREEQLVKHHADKKTICKLTGELNQAFEGALKCVLDSEAWKMDVFYESFIDEIKNADFRDAYDNSVAKAVNTQSITQTDAARPTYTQMLMEGMMRGTGNGNPNFVGSPIQILNAKLFNLSVALGEISNQSGTNNSALQRAFRTIVFSLFDDAAVSLHGETANTHELEQARAESRSIAASFIVRFDNSVRTITAQMLRDTRMTRTELAFHEAWNTTADEVGMTVLGGSDAIASDPEISMTEAEFQRLHMQALLEKARKNAEVMRQWAEHAAKGAEKWRKIMLIAARISAGDNVPPQDKAFLLEHSPGMYMLAKASQIANENPKDHESVLDEAERRGTTSSTGGLSMPSSGQAEQATE